MSKFPWGALIGFFVIVMLAFTLYQIGGIGLDYAGQETLEQQNETLVVNYTTPVTVSFSPNLDRYTRSIDDNETITNSTGTTLVEGTDYEFNTTEGEVSFIDTANTTNGENVNITYYYDYNVDDVQRSEPIVETIISSVPLWVFVPFIVFVAGLLLWMYRLLRQAWPSGGQMMGGRR